MAYTRLVGPGLDYAPCHYGSSKLPFRGPPASTEGGYVAFVGSTETYGKFVETPFPALVGNALGCTALNLGCVNAGIDAFLGEATVVDLCRGARAVVLQTMGAHKLSNRLYSVHPRRNDRFLTASKALRELYPEVDFAEIHFTRHLTRVLAEVCPERFQQIRTELCAAWVNRMILLIRRFEVPTVLLGISEQAAGPDEAASAGGEPMFVTASMIDDLRPHLAHVCEVTTRAGRADAASGLICSEIDLPAARALPGPEDHAVIADRLVPLLGA